MFKNKIKIAVIALFVALPIMLSLAPAELCAMHYLENAGSPSSITKPSWSFSKSRISTFVGCSFDKSKFFVCNHPFLTFGALWLVSLGVVVYYSGLFSGSGDKKAKKEQVSSCKKGEDVKNQWKIKLAILYSLQAVTAFGSNVFGDLSRVFYKMTEPAEKKVEQKKQEVPEKKPEQISKQVEVLTEKQIEKKIVEKEVKQTPDEKAQADLKQLIENYKFEEEPKLLKKQELPTFEDDIDTQDKYISYILFNLNKLKGKDAELRLFINKPGWSSLSSRGVTHYPLPAEGGTGSYMSLFASMLLYHYFDALNLLLSTGAVDFTSAYGEVRDTRTAKPTEIKNSFLGALLVLHNDYKLRDNNENIQEEYKRTRYEVQKNIIPVFASHGATSFENGDEFWEKKVILPKVVPSPNKLYFSSDGTKVITASEFVEQLKNKLGVSKEPVKLAS